MWRWAWLPLIAALGCAETASCEETVTILDTNGQPHVVGLSEFRQQVPHVGCLESHLHAWNGVFVRDVNGAVINDPARDPGGCGYPVLLPAVLDAQTLSQFVRNPASEGAGVVLPAATPAASVAPPMAENIRARILDAVHESSMLPLAGSESASVEPDTSVSEPSKRPTGQVPKLRRKGRGS